MSFCKFCHATANIAMVHLFINTEADPWLSLLTLFIDYGI